MRNLITSLVLSLLVSSPALAQLADCGGEMATVKYAVIDEATSGNNTLVAAVTGKKIRVLNYVMVSGGTVTTRFESGAGGTALSGQMTMFLTVSNPMSISCGSVGCFETAAGELLNLELSAAQSVDGHLAYIECS
jgi:hypothetical protein